MALLDAERRFHRPNEQLAEITGYTVEALEGMPTRNLYVSDEIYQEVADAKKRNIQVQGTSSVETQWVRKDGRTIEAILNASPRSPGNLAAGLIETAMDISDRKRLEQDARIQDANLDAIFNGAPNILALVDHRGRVRKINRTGAAFAGSAIPKNGVDRQARRRRRP